MNKKAITEIESCFKYATIFFLIAMCIGAVGLFGTEGLDFFEDARCRLAGGLRCLDIEMMSYQDSVTFDIMLQNTADFPITGLVVGIDNCGTSSSDVLLEPGKAEKFTITCNKDKGKFKEALRVTFTNSMSNQQHEKTGIVVAEAG